jgi:RimJ/RimL family protein N-acetyltransferase
MIDSVIIEPITKDDDDGFFRLVESDRARLATYFPQTTGHATDRRTTRAYIRDMLARTHQREFFCFVMRDYESGPPIGAVFLKQFDWSVPKCETAYFISSIYQGHGITTLGLIWATDFAFSELEVNKVFARIVPENVASIRVAEKCGYEREGLLRRDFRTSSGDLLDVYLYGRLR